MKVAQTFQSADSRDIPVPCFETWRQECRQNQQTGTEGHGRVEELTGLESWFTLPGAPLHALPKWKMAFATFLGVFPVAMILNLTLGSVIGSWHFVLRNALFNVCVVALLTWIVMPVLTRLLHRWLHPRE